MMIFGEEMDDANIRRKMFVKKCLWENSKFQNFKKQLDSKVFVNPSKRYQDQLTD